MGSLIVRVLGFEVLHIEHAGDDAEPWDSGATGSTPMGFVASAGDQWEQGVER